MNRQERRRARKHSNPPKRKAIWIAGVLCTVLLGIGIALSKKSLEKSESANIDVSATTPELAVAYVKNRLQPILDRALKDTTYPIGVRNRIALLFAGIQKGEIEYSAMQQPHPTNPSAMAHLDFNPESNRPVLIVFAPVIQAMDAFYKSRGEAESNFESEIALTFAHEYIHVELQTEFGSFQSRVGKKAGRYEEEEAAAWGITVLEMLRPMIASGKSLPDLKYYNRMSLELEKSSDNYRDSTWVSIFKGYHKR